MSSLREAIEEKLDNTILDWNSPHQLTSSQVDVIYPILIRVIEQLVTQTLNILLAELMAEVAGLAQNELGTKTFSDGRLVGQNAMLQSVQNLIQRRLQP